MENQDFLFKQNYMENYLGYLGFAGTVIWWAYLQKGRKVEHPPLCEKDLPPFITFEQAELISKSYTTPLYVYDERSLIAQARRALTFPSSYGVTVRFAMKACPNKNVLRLFHNLGLNFDASSGYEVNRALLAGIPGSSISLSAQELPANFEELLKFGIHFNACSLHQLEVFGKILTQSSSSHLSRECGVRFNPGVGSGGTGKTNVGGPSASFGVWYVYIDEVKKLAAKYNIKIIRIHTHIGSGSDPEVWSRTTHMSLALVESFPSVHTLNLGGGYKVARMPYEKSTDLQVIGQPVKALLTEFYAKTGRKIKLEIEPGTFLVANCCTLLCRVQDVVDTLNDSSQGYRFIKVDSGMTEVLRPSLYGAQHPLRLISADDSTGQSSFKYVIVGHCCESGDLFSCEPGNAEALREVQYPREVKIGDFISVEGTGAYCSSMSTKNYNSFPEAPEVLIRLDGTVDLIRKKQSLVQVVQNEVDVI